MQLAPRAPDRRRFVAALTRQPCAEVPYYESEFAPQIASAILGQPVRTRSYHLPPADAVELLRRTGVDVTYVVIPWIEMGFAGLHPIEPCGAFDIHDVKRRYGDRLALLGNIDVHRLLTLGSPDEVRADTLDHLRRLSAGSGYLCGSSHDINADVRLENLAAMIRTICEFRVPGNPKGESP